MISFQQPAKLGLVYVMILGFQSWLISMPKMQVNQTLVFVFSFLSFLNNLLFD